MLGHKKTEHHIEHIANVQTTILEYANDENYGDEYICHHTTQTITAHFAACTLYVDDGESDGKCHWGIEQYVECCAHIGTLCTESMNHLQEVVDGEE